MDRAFLQKLERQLVDDGKLIEAGWVGLRLIALAPDAGALQLQEMREAFFAGAQHLFSSLMGVLDEDSEPTDADMKRMDQIDAELRAFIVDFSKRHGITPPTH